MRFAAFLLISVMLLLTGCVHQRAAVPLTQSWEQRQQALSSLLNWKFRGHFIFKSPANKFSANVFWQQKHNNYDIRVFGPLGFGAAQLQGNDKQVILKDAHAHIYTATNPEALMQQQLGWLLPVSSLYYWLRGLPAPGSVTSIHYDSYHRIDRLRQQGWQIQFVQYMRAQAFELPQEIIFTQNEYYLHLTIEADSWQTMDQQRY